MTLLRLLGRGTQAWIAPLRSGDTTIPTYTPAIPLNASLTTAAKGAVALTLATATSATSVFVANTFINVITPQGKELLVQISADTIGAVTTIPVVALPAAIPTGSTFQYPLRLRFRKTSDVTRNAKTVDTIDFDSGGYGTTVVTSLSYDLKLDGDYPALDSGYKSLDYCSDNFQKIYVWLILPNPDASVYQSGELITGICDVGNTPINIPADGLITANVELKPQGRLGRIPPVVL